MHEPVAIVGGRGYLGQALHARLAAHGIQAWVIGRQSAAQIDPSYSARYRSSTPSLQRAVAGAATVVHLATLTTPEIGEENPALDAENIKFTLSLIDACLKEKVTHLVYASSGGAIYGEAREPVDELHPVNPKCSYAIGKLASEHYLRLFASTASADVTILRMSNPFGGSQVKKGGQGVVSYLANQIARDQPILLYGNTVRDYVYIDDVAGAFLQAMKHSTGFQIYNISTGVGTYLADLAGFVARRLKRELRMDVGGLRSFDLPYNVLKNGKAALELDWRPKHTLEEGLDSLLSGFRPSA